MVLSSLKPMSERCSAQKFLDIVFLAFHPYFVDKFISENPSVSYTAVAGCRSILKLGHSGSVVQTRRQQGYVSVKVDEDWVSAPESDKSLALSSSEPIGFSSEGPLSKSESYEIEYCVDVLMSMQF